MGGLILKKIMKKNLDQMDTVLKKRWAMVVLALKLYSFMDDLKVKGFSLEYLALVAMQRLGGSFPSTNIFETMKQVLEEEKVICMNKNECDTCRNSPNSGIESKSFCSGVIGVFSVDMRTALFILTQLNISPSFMVKTGKEGQLAKMLPFYPG